MATPQDIITVACTRSCGHLTDHKVQRQHEETFRLASLLSPCFPCIPTNPADLEMLPDQDWQARILSLIHI